MELEYKTTEFVEVWLVVSIAMPLACFNVELHLDSLSITWNHPGVTSCMMCLDDHTIVQIVPQAVHQGC